jgi:hypothetical protein
MDKSRIKLDLTSRSEKRPSFINELSQDTLSAMAKRAVGMTAADLLLRTRSLDALNLTPEVRQWSEDKLFSAVQKWQPYNEFLDSPLPTDAEGLMGVITDLDKKLSYLYRSTQNFDRYQNADILLVPYGDMRNQLHQLPVWLANMRRQVGLIPDEIPSSIQMRLNDSNATLQRSLYGDISIATHLAMKSEDRQDWGLLLVGEEYSDIAVADLDELRGRYSPNSAKDFGIFEWFAMSLQEQLDDTKTYALLGSSIWVNNTMELIARGFFDSEQKKYALQLLPANKVLENASVRSVVHPEV